MLSLLRRLPRRAGMLFAGALALYTAHKLYTMSRVRGFVGDYRIESHRVTDKTIEHGSKNRTFCFLSWEDARADQPQRVQADCEHWQTVSPGDRIEVVRLVGDSEVYLRGGDVYSSNGQFVLDFMLLSAELAGVLYYWTRTNTHAQRAQASFASPARKAPPRI